MLWICSRRLGLHYFCNLDSINTNGYWLQSQSRKERPVFTTLYFPCMLSQHNISWWLSEISCPVVIFFNMLLDGSRASKQQIYQAWAKIFQGIEDNFLRPVLKHPIDLWPNGIMMNYSHLEVGQLPLNMHNYLLPNMKTFHQAVSKFLRKIWQHPMCVSNLSDENRNSEILSKVHKLQHFPERVFEN